MTESGAKKVILDHVLTSDRAKAAILAQKPSRLSAGRDRGSLHGVFFPSAMWL